MDETTPRDKADEFFELVTDLAADYDIAAMKADQGIFQISVFSEHGVESFSYTEDHNPNKESEEE